MTKLSLNHVLETELVEWVSARDIHILLAEVELFVLDWISESEEKDGLEQVPLPQTEVDVENLGILLIDIDVVPPGTVIGTLKMNVSS